MSETSMTTFAEDSLNKVSTTREHKILFGGTVQASAAASIGVKNTQQQETYFTHTFARSNMPVDIYGELYESHIEEFVIPETLKLLRGLVDLSRDVQEEMADQFVASHGIAFVSTVTFGGYLEMPSTIKTEQWMTSEVIQASVEASYNALMIGSGSISTSHSVKIKDGKHQSSSEFTTAFHGGDFAVYKNQEAWKKSVEETPIIAEYELMPIYALLPPKKYWVSHMILKAAVARAVNNFDYYIPNFSIKPSIIQIKAIPSGYRYSRDINTSRSYTARADDGYTILGSGYSADLSISAVKLDGLNAKLNT